MEGSHQDFVPMQNFGGRNVFYFIPMQTRDGLPPAPCHDFTPMQDFYITYPTFPPVCIPLAYLNQFLVRLSILYASLCIHRALTLYSP